ncbi:MAG: MFS transporter [Gammaproteobacteria bacterium]
MLNTLEKSKSQNFLWPWVICALGATYYCYEYFLRISPSVMTPELMRTYDLTGAQVGNLSAFYYLAYTPMQLIVGLLMDRYGPRRLLTFACLLCAFGSYLFASGHGLLIAQIGRFLVGFGSAFAFVGALKLATIWLPPNRFALISGIITTLGVAGAMVGDILLRALVDGIGWQTTTFISAVSGLILAAILWTIIRDENKTDFLPHAHVVNFHDLLLGLWGILKNSQIWLVGLIGCLLYLSASAYAELWGIPYLDQARGFSKAESATANSMVFLGWAIGAPFWGWFSDYVGRRCLTIAISTFAALISVCLLLYVPGWSLTATGFLLFLLGFFTSVEIIVFALCREVSSIKVSGTSIAFTNMLIMIGGNVFQPVIGKILDLNWDGSLVEGARVYSASAYQTAMSVLPVAFIIAIILTFFIRETYGKIHVEVTH